MGERSKTIGEIGENIVSNFFKLIGWANSLENQTLKCMKPQKHARPESKTGLRREHGIDFLHSYKSPLESNTVESLIISVKHTEDPYESNPKRTFKNHMTDLSYSLECYSRSELKAEQLKMFQGANRQKDTGVLFWLSSNDETYDDLVAKLSNSRIDPDLKFDTIHVVDNKQIGYIYEVMKYLNHQFSDREVSFYYPETSMNYADKSISRSGSFLPVEFITSPVIPFMIEGSSAEELATFCITSIDEFDEDGLSKLIQAAREYTHEVKCKYLFLFSNYVESHHKEKVIKAKKLFDGKLSSQISVKSFKPDHRSLNDER